MTRALLVASLLIGASSPLRAQFVQFVRGDANRDSKVDISDGVAIFGFLFLGQPNPGCDDAMDANDSGRVDISDGIYDLSFLFTGGTRPLAPFPDCGGDPTPDDIGCDSYPNCVICLNQAALDAAIRKEVPPVVCIEAGAETITIEALIIEVCPLANAPLCGEGEARGCPVNFDVVEGLLDVPAEQVVVHIEGHIDSLPLLITNTSNGSQTLCDTDITFSADAVVPFLTQEDAEGNLVLVQILDVTLQDAETSLTSTGGLICTLLQGLQDAFQDQIIAELQTAATDLLVDLNMQLAGSLLCE
jgi:hypothetical protein